MEFSRDVKRVGRVVGLWRYPVKSMAGEALTTVDVSWHGLVGDRRWAFVRNDVPLSGFPWLTLRERADMSHYQPSFIEPDQPDKSPLVVKTPRGETIGIGDTALAGALHPSGARLIKQDRGVFDTFPLSLISTRSIARLGEKVGTPMAVQRFRPNILIEAAGDAEFPEDEWVGCVLRVGGMGGMRMRVDKRDGRCVVITIDPETGARNPSILRAVASERQGCLGVYGTTVEPGSIAIGDAVWLKTTA
jgi:uncharacterized protein